MRFILVPDRVFSRYDDITPALLAGEGVRLLLCDLDYTLAPKSVLDADDAVRRWIGALRAAGIAVMVLSNNRRPARVKRFCGTLDIPYVGHAKKPLPAGLRRAMASAGVTAAQTAMLGDKLLTDVLAAKLGGVRAWMVEPLGGAVTVWQRVLHGMQAPFKAAGRRPV